MARLIGHEAALNAGPHDRRLGAVIVASVVVHAALLIGTRPSLTGGSASRAVPIVARLVAAGSALPRATEPVPATAARDSTAGPPAGDPVQVANARDAAVADRRPPPSAARSDAQIRPVTEEARASRAASSTAVREPVPPPSAEAGLTSSAASALSALLDGYKSAGLDPPPRPLGDIEPEYPAAAGLQEGVVALRLLINEAGTVDRVLVLRATPAGFFEESATRAFAAARFAPGRFLGIPVKSQITVEVEFTPINRGSVGGRTY